MPYAVHTNIITTVFWVGEEAGPDSKFIPNYASSWDSEWLRHFGGVDTQAPRSGNLPALFTPTENAFYFALPYNDLDANGNTKPNAGSEVPWASTDPVGPGDSLVKNHWIRIEANGQVAYAQWEDAGPNGENDVNYVFGTANPTNTFGARAGLDVSPAVQHFFGQGDVFTVTSWQFVDFADVPDGPWKTTITTTQVDFDVANDKTPTIGNDWLVGKVGIDLIHAKMGNDRVFGSAGNDQVFGDAGDDLLYGGTGNDEVNGGAGRDTISGESGNDIITGSVGGDWLWGDRGRDTFDYNSASDSGVANAARDRIGDFRHDIDMIDLFHVDANSRRGGDQAFAYIGSKAFSGDAGELHFVRINAAGTADDKTIIEADRNGDRIADFAIELTGLVTLSRGDFIL